VSLLNDSTRRARTAPTIAACTALLAGLCTTSAFAADSKPTNDKLPAWAPQPPPNVIEDRFRVEVTVLGAALDTTLRVDPSLAVQGTQINAEDDLGLEDSKLLALGEITLLPGDRHLVRLSGFSVRRSANKLLDRTIVFDDQTYNANERVDSTLNLTMLGLTYGYSIVQMRRFDLALTFGIQIIEVEANAVVRSRVVRDSETGVSPLPLAGIEGRFDFTPHWSFEARAQYLSVDFDEINGTLLDARGALTWRANPHLLFGLGYRIFTVEVDSRDDDTPGFVDMSMKGPQLFMRASL
jgi:hypothetical protein